MMELPTLFKPEASDARYLAIVLTDTYVQAALWSFEHNRVILLEKSDLHEYASEKECQTQTDVAIQELGNGAEGVDEVVFGLEPEWVVEGEIKNEKKPVLKDLTTVLSLKAVGFVVTIEALHQYLVKAQPQLSALLIQSQARFLRVSFVRQGILLRTELVGKSDTIVADITEALARWTAPDELAAAYPSRIVLTSDQLADEEISSEEQVILNHDWVAEKLFLHPPVVEVLKTGTMLEAVVNEGGKAVAQTEGLILPDEAAQAEPISVDDENIVPVTSTQAKSFGIPMQTEEVETAVAPHLMNHEPVVLQPEPIIESELAVVSVSRPRRRWGFGRLGRAGTYSHHPFIVAGVVLGLLFFAIGSYSFLRLTTKAVVQLTLKTVPITKNVTINLDPSTPNGPEGELRLAAQRTERDFEKSKTIPTTGVKQVGEAAKGKITIFNKTTSSKSFAAGTELTSGSLKFTLDKEVSVASASVVTNGGSETKTFGKSDATVTAVAIGTESNIAKDKELKIASFDAGTYSATSAEAFTGGASREMRVVAEADRQKVATQLRSEIVDEATQTFKKESQGATYTVPSGKMTLKTTTYSAKTGDEAEELRLDLVATVEGFTYQTDQLKPLALQTLSQSVPAGYELKPESLQVLSEPQTPTGSGSAQVIVEANLAAQARPIIDHEQIKTKIASQGVSRAEEILKAESTVSGFGFTFNPTISRWLIRMLPPASRLSIETK